MARINYSVDKDKATELHIDSENSKAFIHIFQYYIYIYILTGKYLPMCSPLSSTSPKSLF